MMTGNTMVGASKAKGCLLVAGRDWEEENIDSVRGSFGGCR